MNAESLLQDVKSYLESDSSAGSNPFRESERLSLLKHVSEAVGHTGAPSSSSTPIEDQRGRSIRRIMVAVDSSEQAGFGLKLAAGLARDLHCELSLIHVVHVPVIPNPDLAYEQIEMHPALVDAGQSILDRAARFLSQFKSVETILREGDPATEITDAATRLGADLIIIGTHGRGRFASAIVGSVAQGVMRKATCPVLCVAHDPSISHWTLNIGSAAQADYFPVAGA